MTAALDKPELLPTLAKLAKEELARRFLLDFCELMDPRFMRARHLEYTSTRLDALLERKPDRLKCGIAFPLRMGKTTLLRNMIAKYIGLYPNHSGIFASYNDELAEASARAILAMILENDNYPFKNVTIRKDSRAVSRFETSEGGIWRFLGVGSGATGFGGEIIAVDDIVKSRADAESPKIRESTKYWFEDVLSTRAHPNAIWVAIGTRWHESDIMGEILTRDDWQKIVLPFYAEANDPLGRVEGELIWPQRFGPNDVPSVERGEITSRSFAALYQQRPAPASGNLLMRSWFENYYDVLPPRMPQLVEPSFLETVYGYSEARYKAAPICIQSVDTAIGVSEKNDYTVICTFLVDATSMYLVDVTRVRAAFPDLPRLIYSEWQKHDSHRIYIEEAGPSGRALIEQLRRSTGLPLFGVLPVGNKIARCELYAAPMLEAGLVKFPRHAPWMESFVEECVGFPAYKFDDCVDSLGLGCQMIAEYRAHEAHASSKVPSGLYNYSDFSNDDVVYF